jgi:hypothetical protein
MISKLAGVVRPCCTLERPRQTGISMHLQLRITNVNSSWIKRLFVGHRVQTIMARRTTPTLVMDLIWLEGRCLSDVFDH